LLGAGKVVAGKRLYGRREDGQAEILPINQKYVYQSQQKQKMVEDICTQKINNVIPHQLAHRSDCTEETQPEAHLSRRNNE